ncbi:MAG: hypothetical protein IPK82_13450 [Polyangiaceae bacterium]|nr:hypothetical protein [Polyangiaceae bacterium]
MADLRAEGSKTEHETEGSAKQQVRTRTKQAANQEARGNPSIGGKREEHTRLESRDKGRRWNDQAYGSDELKFSTAA